MISLSFNATSQTTHADFGLSAFFATGGLTSSSTQVLQTTWEHGFMTIEYDQSEDIGQLAALTEHERVVAQCLLATGTHLGGVR